MEKENADGNQDWNATSGDNPANGTWVASSARYYIRIANQLLVEDKDFGQETRGFVILTADLNVRLLSCHKGKGAEDFHRLINENAVQSSPEAAEAAQVALLSASTPNSKKSSGGNEWSAPVVAASDGKKASNTRKEAPTGGADKDGMPSVRKLSDMSRGLRECLVDVMDDRDRAKKESLRVADMYTAFALDGDLDQGLQLMDYYAEVRHKAQSSSSKNDNEDEDKADIAADDAMYLSQKLEKSLVKILRSGSELVNNPDEEIELLRRGVKKLKKELEERDREVQNLRSGGH
eukprot:gene24526-30881_t